MKMIDHIVEQIDEELEGAKDYAEEYIRHKAKGEMVRANKYKDMANDELRHAANVHDFAIADIEDVKRVYPIPTADEEKWDKAHKHYVECMGWIRQMLT